MISRYLIVGAIAVATGAWVNGVRWEAKHQALQLEHASEKITRADKNMEALRDNQTKVLDAIQNSQYAAARNEESYAKLTTSVSSLSRTVGGLRGDFAGLPGFIRDASQETLGQYATTCSAIFERMAERGAGMGEAGARISRQADLHAADALKLGPVREQP